MLRSAIMATNFTKSRGQKPEKKKSERSVKAKRKNERTALLHLPFDTSEPFQTRRTRASKGSSKIASKQTTSSRQTSDPGFNNARINLFAVEQDCAAIPAQVSTFITHSRRLAGGASRSAQAQQFDSVVTLAVVLVNAGRHSLFKPQPARQCKPLRQILLRPRLLIHRPSPAHLQQPTMQL